MAKKLSEADEQVVKDEAAAEKAFQQDQQRDSGGPNPQLDAEAATDSRVEPEAVPHTTVDPIPPAGAPEPTDEELVRAHLGQDEMRALVIAEAKRRAAEKAASAEAKAAADAEEKARAERREAPMNYVGLDVGKSGSYVYMRLTKPPIAPDRTVRIGPTTFEHVDEDADGVWLYRHMA